MILSGLGSMLGAVIVTMNPSKEALEQVEPLSREELPRIASHWLCGQRHAAWITLGVDFHGDVCAPGCSAAGVCEV